jgi:hypothetical protein
MRAWAILVSLTSFFLLGCASQSAVEGGPAAARAPAVRVYYLASGRPPACPYRTLSPFTLRLGLNRQDDLRRVREAARSRSAHGVINFVRGENEMTGQYIQFTDPDCMY